MSNSLSADLASRFLGGGGTTQRSRPRTEVLSWVPGSPAYQVLGEACPPASRGLEWLLGEKIDK